MGLVLQQGGIPVDEVDRWLDSCQAFAGIDAEARTEILAHMQREGILFEHGGILGFGPRGEELYGRRNFLELFSVFLSPPLFAIRHGRQELGSVDVTTFLSKKDGPRVLLLGGRSWLVEHIDWTRKVAHVEPTEHQGRSRWLGDGPLLGFALCQSIQALLADDEVRECWSRRAVERLRERRHDYAWLQSGSTTLLMGPKGQPEWWTSGGLVANTTLAGGLAGLIPVAGQPNNFRIVFEAGTPLTPVEDAVRALPDLDPALLRPAIDPDAQENLKFSDRVPPELIQHELEARLSDPNSARTLLLTLSRTNSAGRRPHGPGFVSPSAMRPQGSAQELERRRRRAVQAVHDGDEVADVARIFGVSERAIRGWLAAERDRGEQGLAARPHPGPKPRLNRSQQRQVFSWLKKLPSAFGFPTELWTAPRVGSA